MQQAVDSTTATKTNPHDNHRRRQVQPQQLQRGECTYGHFYYYHKQQHSALQHAVWLKSPIIVIFAVIENLKAVMQLNKLRNCSPCQNLSLTKLVNLHCIMFSRFLLCRSNSPFQHHSHVDNVSTIVCLISPIAFAVIVIEVVVISFISPGLTVFVVTVNV